MGFLFTNLLLVALYIATWTRALPTTAGMVSKSGLESNTNAVVLNTDFSSLSNDFSANDNANTKADPLPTKPCALDSSCSDTIANRSHVRKCSDRGGYSRALDCGVLDHSATVTSTFISSPTQARATSVATPGASATTTTLACFDTRSSVAKTRPEVEMELPRLYPDPPPSPTLAPDTDSDVSVTLTMTVLDGPKTHESNAPLTTLSEQLIPTVILTTQNTSPFLVISTASSTLPTSAQSTPTDASLKSTSDAQKPNHTAAIAGGTAGSLVALAISIVTLDHLIKRRRNERRRSISESSDDAILAQHKQEQQEAYGYYGTNRAATILKGMGVFKANAEPAELPAEAVAADRR